MRRKKGKLVEGRARVSTGPLHFGRSGPVVLALTAVVLLAAGCGSSSSPSSSVSASSNPTSLAAIVTAELAGQTPPAAQAVLDTKIPLTIGQPQVGYPKGVPPSSANIFTFTKAEIATLKAGNYTAAIAMHVENAAWPLLQIQGITSTLADFGIKVVATTNADGIASTQVSQLGTLIARKPTAIFSIPIDPVAEASEYAQVSAAGIKLVLMDNGPTGLIPGKQYVTLVSANNGGNGEFAASQLEKLIGCAPMGVIGLDYYYPVVNARDTAALKVFSSDCSEQLQYTQNLPNLVTTAAYPLAASLLTQHTNIKGFWAGWDSIADEIIAAEKAAGVKIPIATTDLGPDSALDIAQGYVIASGGQQPYAQGVAEANALAYNLLGKKVPPFIELPTVPVTLTDLIPAYKIINHSTMPSADITALKQAVGLG
jgi:ribose transport system substrate-binding protein